MDEDQPSNEGSIYETPTLLTVPQLETILRSSVTSDGHGILPGVAPGTRPRDDTSTPTSVDSDSSAWSVATELMEEIYGTSEVRPKIEKVGQNATWMPHSAGTVGDGGASHAHSRRHTMPRFPLPPGWAPPPSELLAPRHLGARDFLVRCSGLLVFACPHIYG